MTDFLPVAETYDCTDPETRTAGLDAAVEAIAAGRLVLLPTDTVYGVAADAFDPDAVTALLAAKNRGRGMPVPVLIGEASTLAGLVVHTPPAATALAQAFWPGGLTLVLEHAPSLAWDLGDAEGTVAVRLPDDDLTRDLLRRTGPLAVSSANRSGRPAATTAQEAAAQLGEHAAVVLDGGPRTDSGGQHDRRLHRPRATRAAGRRHPGGPAPRRRPGTHGLSSGRRCDAERSHLGALPWDDRRVAQRCRGTTTSGRRLDEHACSPDPSRAEPRRLSRCASTPSSCSPPRWSPS